MSKDTNFRCPESELHVVLNPETDKYLMINSLRDFEKTVDFECKIVVVQEDSQERETSNLQSSLDTLSLVPSSTTRKV